MIRRPPRSTQSRSSAASDVYKRQDWRLIDGRKRRPWVADRHHLKAAIECQGGLLHNQVVEAPGSDRKAPNAVVETCESSTHKGELIAHGRDDADVLDGLQFFIPALERCAGGVAQEENGGRRENRALMAVAHGAI